MQIKNLKEERNKTDLENEKLQRQLEESINALKVLEKEARFLESSNNKLASMLVVAERDHSDVFIYLDSSFRR
jgi:septal ring factor EnvC (AmiA/AmiB activator)